ncbi:MAG: penicillin-binding protein 1C, partial [Flavobacteriaceae bacterium]
MGWWLQKHRIGILVFVACFLTWWFSLPKHLFPDPTSTVVTASNGTLLGARIADDGQWRFPQIDSVPRRFEQCILHFEDAYFHSHPGFNPISIAKALWHNLTQPGRRGGSTLTQQVIRLSRKNKKRSYLEKFVELFMATRLEVRFSKRDILALYASNAPFGGNVIGLETASWRYYGIPVERLSWGQSATLAVLPNAPSLIFPGRNDSSLLYKRNRLLKKLAVKKIIDQTTYELAKAEPLPQKPLPLPNLAPHFVERIKKEHNGLRINSSIDLYLQQHVNALARSHHARLRGNDIHNLAILVLDIPSRKVIAYVGNAPSGASHGESVDIISSKRSTGSILKPILFASAMDDGLLLPNTLLTDVPTVINGYSPKNFDNGHSGAVPASRALSRSLNVPAVRLLRQYGLQKFHGKLQKMNLRSIDRPAYHYGLSLILGGAEASLWDIVKTYAAMAHTVTVFGKRQSIYRSYEYQDPSYIFGKEPHFGEVGFDTPILHAGAIYNTLKALREVNRPEGEENWEFFNEAHPIAWKTGTSYGFKDAWAVGTTPKYAIGVWAGNADGEGRPGLTGINAAAPILFDVLNHLPKSGWFAPPYDDLIELEVCSKSGHRASVYCENSTTERVPLYGKRTPQCPYHHQIFLDRERLFQVNAQCYPLEDMMVDNHFSLPTIMEHYYVQKHMDYKPLPPFKEGCSIHEDNIMEFIV